MPSDVFVKFNNQLVKEIKKLPNVCEVEKHALVYADKGSRLYNPRCSNSSHSLRGSCVIVTYNRSTNQDTSGKAWV